MNSEDDSEPAKTPQPQKPKPYVAVETFGHRPNLTLLVAMTSAMSMPMGDIILPPKPPKSDEDSVV